MQKIKVILNRVLFIIIVIFIALLIIESEERIQVFLGLKSNDEIVEEQKEKQVIETSYTSNINIDENKLNIIFFDVGQADSTLIICNNKVILIDAGNTFDGRKIVDGIKSLGIEKIDYLIGTHAHEDHLGGMSFIVDSFEIENYYMPYCSSNEFSFYSRLISSLSNKNISINNANIGDVFDLGTGKLEVMEVNNDEPENLNESSIILELSYGNLKYLFMSDAEIVNEEFRSWDDVDVLKVGHHGSDSSSSQEFLNQVLPEISVISVGTDNDYELPKQTILERLENIGSNIYRTDLDGTIQIVSDGEKNEIIKIDESFDG